MKIQNNNEYTKTNQNNQNGWTIIDSNNPLEKIMRDALLSSDLKFEEQVSIYEKYGSFPRYIIDFVVYGTNYKIAVECDGYTFHRNSLKKIHSDKRRDQWLRLNGFSSVLRFTTNQIKGNVQKCISDIRNTIVNLEYSIVSKNTPQNPRTYQRKKTISSSRSNRLKVTKKENHENLKLVEIYAAGTAMSMDILSKGGIGIVLKYKDHTKEIKIGYQNTNLWRMRLIAVIKGLQQLKYPCKVLLYTDNGYICHFFNRYLGNQLLYNPQIVSKKMKNYDLWFQLIDQLSDHEVSFHKVHSVNRFLVNKYFNQAKSLSRQATFCIKSDQMFIDQLNSFENEYGCKEVPND